MAVPKLKDQGSHVIPLAQCGKCGQRLHYKQWSDERNVPCINTRIIVENFCPNCGEPVDGYKEEK